MGARPAILPALGGASAPKGPGPASPPPTHATPASDPGCLTSHPGRQPWRGCGAPHVPGCRCEGLGPPLQKVPTSIPFQVRDEGGEGDPPRRPFKRPEGDRDLGPGWRAPGRGGGRQPPGRLRLGPHVTAPRARKGLENLPLPPPLPPPTNTPPLGVGTLGDQKTVEASLFFIECFKNKLSFKRQLPK